MLGSWLYLNDLVNWSDGKVTEGVGRDELKSASYYKAYYDL